MEKLNDLLREYAQAIRRDDGTAFMHADAIRNLFDASHSRECGERQGAAFDEIRDALNETYGFASTSPRGQENINFALGKLDEIEQYCANIAQPSSASGPTLGEQWPSYRDAAIQACALMILGICKTRPQEVWPKEIEGRIRYMLSKIAPAAAQPGLTDEKRIRVRDAIAEAIGGAAYDCTRAWEAWYVGTMSADDFLPMVDDGERLSDIADAAINALLAKGE